MRILVTGGAGYIGSITLRTLLDRGHDCVVIDSLERSSGTAIDPRAQFVQARVGNRDALDECLPGCDAVMHLAGLIEVAESQIHPARYLEANVAQGAVLLEAMSDHDVHALVFSSTAAVYGEPEVVPIPENAPTRPINAYGLSKLMFEQLLDWANACMAIESIRFRYFNVAGAWPDGSLGEAHDPETHIIPRILTAGAAGDAHFDLYGDDYPTADGSCVRDYIHVCDLAQAHALALEHLGDGGLGSVFNLGSGRGYSNREILGECARITGVEPEVTVKERRPGDPAVLIADASRATTELGWAPERTQLSTMVEDAWRWHSRARN